MEIVIQRKWEYKTHHLIKNKINEQLQGGEYEVSTSITVYAAAPCGRNIPKSQCETSGTRGHQAIPVGNTDPSDVDRAQGNKVRLRVSARNYLTDMAGKRHAAAGGNSDKLIIKVMSLRGHKASYCMHKVGESCNFSNFDNIKTGAGNAHVEAIVSMKTNFTTDLYNLTIKNDSSGRQKTSVFSVMHRSDFGTPA